MKTILNALRLFVVLAGLLGNALLLSQLWSIEFGNITWYSPFFIGFISTLAAWVALRRAPAVYYAYCILGMLWLPALAWSIAYSPTCENVEWFSCLRSVVCHGSSHETLASTLFGIALVVALTTSALHHLATRSRAIPSHRSGEPGNKVDTATVETMHDARPHKHQNLDAVLMTSEPRPKEPDEGTSDVKSSMNKARPFWLAVASASIVMMGGGGIAAYRVYGSMEPEPCGVVRAYFATTSLEDRLRLVTAADKVRPHINEYYAVSPPTTPKVTFGPFSDEWKNWYKSAPIGSTFTLRFMVDNADEQQMCIKKTQSGCLIDWDCSYGYSEMTLPAFKAQMPTKGTVFRLYASLSDYYNYEFSHAAPIMYSIKLRDQQNNYITGYTLKQGGEELFELLKDGQEHSCMVLLAYPATKRDTGVAACQFLKSGWNDD